MFFRYSKTGGLLFRCIWFSFYYFVEKTNRNAVSLFHSSESSQGSQTFFSSFFSETQSCSKRQFLAMANRRLSLTRKHFFEIQHFVRLSPTERLYCYIICFSQSTWRGHTSVTALSLFHVSSYPRSELYPKFHSLQLRFILD